MTKTATLAIEAGAEGLSPVELLLGIVRDENQSLTFRAQCAGIILPYVTPRLANVQIERKPNNAVLDKLLAEIKAHQAVPVPAVSSSPLLLQSASQDQP
ncbi:MAG: hypothetical protein JO126_02415 [Alphaproteobacteria bacterium]|nr:hypothetical protein [Alphaproteobacteria bacterium]